MSRLGRVCAALLAAAAVTPARAQPLHVPFDYSRSALGLQVTVHGRPLFMLLDTGVDPSVIDARLAEALGLAVDRSGGGEASGEGTAEHSVVYPATLDGLVIQGRPFRPFAALAADTGGIADAFGRPVDGVLGYSFLADKVALIDYRRSTVSLLDRAAQASARVRGCRKTWRIPLRFTETGFPVVPVRFGTAEAPVTLDTGSNGGLALYQAALDLPGVREALRDDGETTTVGARGRSTARTSTLALPIAIGPFRVPPGAAVTVRQVKGSPHERVGNAGNPFFADLGLKLLLDYPGKRLTVFGDCR